MRFIVAIPNFNHGESLVGLLDQLLLENADCIYVLDDASTDNSIELLKRFLDKITLVKGPYNLGPGGNRNRIIPHLEPGDIVMFIDADMRLETTGARKIIQDLFDANPDIALFGGGIYNLNGSPMTYNYGKHQSQARHNIGLAIERISQVLHFRPLIKLLRPLALKYTYNIEIRYFEPLERVVQSVSEAHFYIRGDYFKKLNGFNENLRYHEGAELAYRLRKEGGHIKFTPLLWATHLKIHSREKLRTKETKKLEKIISAE